jgi:hypothetical protein
MRKLMTGNWPVLGLPLLFWLTGSDDAPCRRAIEQFGDLSPIRSLAGYIIVTRESDFSEVTWPESAMPV